MISKYKLIRYGIEIIDIVRKKSLINKPAEIKKDLENILKSTKNLADSIKTNIHNDYKQTKNIDTLHKWNNYKTLSTTLEEFIEEISNKKNKTIYESIKDIKRDIKYLIDLNTYARATQNILINQAVEKQQIDKDTVSEITSFVQFLKFNHEQISQHIDIDLEDNIKEFELKCSTLLKDYIHHQRTHQGAITYVKEAKVDLFINTFLGSITEAPIRYVDEEITYKDIDVSSPWFREGIKLKSKDKNFQGFIGYVSKFSYKNHVLKATKDKTKKHLLFYVVDKLDKTTAKSIEDAYSTTTHLYVYNLDDHNLHYPYKDFHAYANERLFTGGCVRSSDELTQLKENHNEVIKWDLQIG